MHKLTCGSVLDVLPIKVGNLGISRSVRCLKSMSENAHHFTYCSGFCIFVKLHLSCLNQGRNKMTHLLSRLTCE